MKEKIIRYFEENKLSKPGVINYIGKWVHGERYAVTCGLVRLKKYCVYITNSEVTNVRLRTGDFY